MNDERQRGRGSGSQEGQSGQGIVGERERYGSSQRSPRERGGGGLGMQRRRDSGASLDAPRHPVSYLTSPWELMRRMSEDMDRLFEAFHPGRMQGMQGMQGMQSGGGMWAPELEMERRGNDLCIRADLPGLKPEDIEVNLEDGVLTIEGERQHQSRDEKQGMLRSERSYGRFVRAIQVPEGVEESDIEATFRDGVLEIVIPVPERQQRRIQVKS